MAGTNYFTTITNVDGNLEDVALTDRNGDIFLSKGLTFPSDGKAGYAKGAMFMDTDASATSVMYLNEGSNTSTNFNVINPAATSATKLNDIGDSDGNGTVAMAGNTQDYTSTLNAANTVWSLANTTADLTSEVVLFGLDFTDNADVDGIFVRFRDNSAADTMFEVGANGATTITGSALGTAALTLTAGDAVITSGDITVSAGDIDIAADNKKISFGAAGDTDAYIQFDASDLVFFDSNHGSATLSSLAGSGLSSPTISGDMTLSDGKFTWTNNTAELSGAWTFSGTTTNDITIASSVTTGKVLEITVDGLTSGTGVRVDNTAAGMTTGNFFDAFDGSAIVWEVGDNGVNTIAGGAGADAMILTAGHLQMSDGDIDMDEGKIEVDTTSAEISHIKRNNSGVSSAVFEVEETNTTGTGTGILVDVNSTGNSKGIEISHDGDLAALEIGAGAARTGNVINVVMANQLAQTAIDITGAATGTSSEGIVHIDITGVMDGDGFRVDSTGANATTSALFKGISSGNQAGATAGIVAHFQDTGNAAATSYTVYIDSTNNEALHVDAGVVQFDENFTVGVDGTGGDVKFFGDTTAKFMVWDQSADDLILTDATALQLGGDESTADGFKIEFDGTATLDLNSITAGDIFAIGDNVATGFTVAAVTIKPDSNGDTASTILPGVTNVALDTNTTDADDWFLLPAVNSVPVGHQIRIAVNGNANCEMRTPSGSNEKVNTVDADGGSAEYLCVDAEVVIVTKVSDTDGWTAMDLPALGGVGTATIPDA